MQSQRRTAFESKRKDFRSYADANELVDWLNRLAPSRPSVYQQTVRLIELLKQVSQAEAPTAQQRLEVERLLLPLRGLKWKLAPRLTARGGIGWYSTQFWPPDLHTLVLAARLSERGLDWVRQCPCGRWFLGRTRRSRFCSLQCKKAFEADQRRTPAGREQRRLYMRTLRTRMKEGRLRKRKQHERA